MLVYIFHAFVLIIVAQPNGYNYKFATYTHKSINIPSRNCIVVFDGEEPEKHNDMIIMGLTASVH